MQTGQCWPKQHLYSSNFFLFSYLHTFHSIQSYSAISMMLTKDEQDTKALIKHQ